MQRLYFYYDWYNQTYLNNLSIVALLLVGVLVLVANYKYLIVALLFIACFISVAQRISIWSLDFTALRIIEAVGWVKIVLTRNLHDNFAWNKLDSAASIWALASIVVFSISRGTLSSFIYQIGASYDVLGIYFLFRIVIHDWDALYIIVRSFIVLSFPVATLFLIEKYTGRNIFSMFGGVPEITIVREGHLRCQGAFAHPIIAGCFWASMLPLMYAMLRNTKRYAFFVFFGILCSMAIVISTASSTPILALVLGIIGSALYVVRYQVKRIATIFVFLIILGSLMMKAPVWHLISRIDLVGGSTGWHRYFIIDETIRHFKDWWLLGEADTTRWGDVVDITNQYTLEAINGGLLGLSTFVLVIVRCFKEVSKALVSVADTATKKIFVWSVGASVFIHVCVFIVLSYFGQMTLIWSLTLAICGSLNGLGTRESQDAAWSSTSSEAVAI